MPAASNPAAVDAFWTEALKSLPPDAAKQGYQLRCIGSSLAVSETILTVVLAGQKTGTFSLPWIYPTNPEARPPIYGLSIITNYDGIPKAIVRTLSLTVLTYGQVDETHTAIESPGARPLDKWQAIHWPYWTKMLEPLGMTPSADMPVCLERFQLLYPK